MENRLEILRYYRDKSKKGAIAGIVYNEKLISSFDAEAKSIDLSVLNPFVGKEAYVYDINIDTLKEDCKKVLIERLENKPNLGWVVYLNEIKDEGEDDNASSED